MAGSGLRPVTLLLTLAFADDSEKCNKSPIFIGGPESSDSLQSIQTHIGSNRRPRQLWPAKAFRRSVKPPPVPPSGSTPNSSSQKTNRRDQGNAGAWPRLVIHLSPENQVKTMDAKPEHNAAPKVINGRINGRFAQGFLETLAARRKLRAERSTSAFCSIWRRTGSSMGERCSSGFGASRRLRI